MLHAVTALPSYFDLKRLFVLDSLSLVLFAMVLLGIADHLSAAPNILLQTLFVITTLVSSILFLSRRAFGMVLIKLSMLASIYMLDAAVYII